MLEDYVWRAYGLLRYARSLSSAEAMELLRRVRLGFGLYLVTNVQPSLFNQLLVAMQPAFLQKQAGRTLTPVSYTHLDVYKRQALYQVGTVHLNGRQ